MKYRASLAAIIAVLALLSSLGIGVGGASGAVCELGTEASAGTAAPAALGTSFTYQGLLRDGSGPVNATCDLQFKLWDAASGGSQVSWTWLLEDVVLADGLFTARLDFGAEAFRGEARYLEVAASCPVGSAFVPLPRQELTGSPYALWALGAPWMGLTGIPADLADGDQDTTYSAGTGLSLVGGQFSVNFAGTGSASTVARSDHNHAGAYWQLGGNTGTVPGTNYLGTTDNAALELKVNGARALRLEPNAESPNVIGGYSGNWVTDGVYGATIGGGGAADNGIGEPGLNGVAARFATVAGGVENTASGNGASVGGGWRNTASGPHSVVGGGWSNEATGGFATVAGGIGNLATNGYAAVCGGAGNMPSGYASFVGGGVANSSSGDYGVVGGGHFNQAQAAYTTVSGGGDDENPDLGNRATDAWGTIGGGRDNQAGDDAGDTTDRPYATVGGGANNVASGHGATVGGGWANVASAVHSTVAGGSENRASDSWGTVAGGYNNQAGDNAGSTDDRPYATVGGGRDNIASGTSSVVAGGDTNTASGDRSTVPGGVGNVAAGHHSFAAGRRAKANHNGAFVWADDLNVDFASTNTNTFRVRATNGAEFVANNAGYGLIAANNGAGDGLRAMTNSSAGSNWAAVYAVNLGTSPAVYADSAGTYSGYFLDNIYVEGNCVGCTTAFLAVNDGDRALETGDLVAAKGMLDPVAGSGQPTLAVNLAGGNNLGVIGVVQGRVTLAATEKDGVESQSMELAEGAVSPGEYLLVVVQGFARIKVDRTAGAIVPGQRLTAGRQAGTARALETRMIDGMVVSEGAPVIGVALAPPEPGSDLVPVFVNLQ